MVTHTHNVSEIYGVKINDLMYTTEIFFLRKKKFYSSSMSEEGKCIVLSLG